jgi:hypothetical protein
MKNNYKPEQKDEDRFKVTGFGSVQEDFIDEAHTDLTPYDLVSHQEYSYNQ